MSPHAIPHSTQRLSVFNWTVMWELWSVSEWRRFKEYARLKVEHEMDVT